MRVVCLLIEFIATSYPGIAGHPFVLAPSMIYTVLQNDFITGVNVIPELQKGS